MSDLPLLFGRRQSTDLFRASFSQDLATLPATLYRNDAPATITPTVGPTELAVNGNFAAWTGDNPDSWNLYSPETAGHYVTQSPAGVMQIANDGAGGGDVWGINQAVAGGYGWYRVGFDYLAHTGASNLCFGLDCSGLAWVPSFSLGTLGTYYISARGTLGAPTLVVRANSTGTISIDNISLQALTFPSCLGDVRTLTQSDYIAQVGCNVVAGTQIGLVFALDDAANPQNYALAYIDGTNIHLVQVVAGVYAAESINVAQAVTQGAMVGVAKTGNSVVLTYGGVAVGTPQTLNAALCANVKVGLFSTYSGNFFTQPFLVQKPNVIPCDIGSLVATDSYSVTELIVNGGFETVTAPPVADGWAGVGTIEDETTLVHSGGHAVKLTGALAYVYRGFTVIPGLQYSLSLWTAGDGTNAGRYEVWDATNSTDIIPRTSTGITAAVYALAQVTFTAPAGCTSIEIYPTSPAAVGGIAYFDDISVKPVSPLLSVSGGVLNDKGSMPTAADGTPGLWSNAAYARVSGRALKATITQADATLISEIGWDANQAGLIDTGFRIAADTLLPRVNGTLGPTVAIPADATSIDLLTLLLSTGALFLYRVGQVGPFTLLWRGNAGTTTPLYVGLGGRTAALTAKNVLVRDLPLSDWSLCQARVASPAATATIGDIQAIGTTDFLAEVSPTIADGETAGLLLCIDDPANIQNCVKIWHDKTNLHLAKMVGGSYAADSISAAATYVAGGRIVARRYGNVWSAFYNNVKIGADITISDAGIINNKNHTWTASAVTCSFSEMQLWPGYPQLPGGIL